MVCGNNPPLTSIDTADNFAYIRFVSDSSESSTGFNLTFQASEDGDYKVIWSKPLLNICVSECGGELTGPGGTLQTPNYPNAYDHSRVCTWLITVASDRRVTLSFNAFDVEGGYSQACYYDHVEVCDR